MKYFFYISGMHCSGCKNLITFCLQDLEFINVSINAESNSVTFNSNKKIEDIRTELDNLFKSDLSDYNYSNLSLLND